MEVRFEEGKVLSSIEIFGQPVDAKDIRYIGMEVETAGIATTLSLLSRPTLIFAAVVTAISAIWVGLNWSTLAMVFVGAAILAALYFASVFVLSPDHRVRRPVPVAKFATAAGEKKVVGPGTLDVGAWVASTKMLLELEGFFGLEHQDEDGHGFLYSGIQKEA